MRRSFMTNKLILTARIPLTGLLFLFAGYTSSIAETLRMGGTGAGLQLLQKVGEAYAATTPDVQIEIVPSLGTSGGIRALADGAIDIGVASRALKTEEAKTGLREFGVARTAFVLVTSRSNAESLHAHEVAAAFGGESSWPDKSPMRIVLRPETESDTRLLEKYFPGMPQALSQARLRPEIPVAATDQDNATAAEKTQGSLTGASLVQLLTEARDLRSIRIDGVEPTLANLESGRYPYEKKLHFLVSETGSPATMAFAKFLQSQAAAATMREFGILPIGR
jgi:phosphate transport system substrate-binding protein